MLKFTRADAGDQRLRIMVLHKISEIAAKNAEAACLIATSGFVKVCISENLEIEDGQQELAVATLNFTIGIASQVPHSKDFVPLLPLLIDLACASGKRTPFRLLQIGAAEVLAHLSYSNSTRREIATLLNDVTVHQLMLAALDKDVLKSQDLPQHVFTVGLLLANLCDLSVGDGRFGERAREFWAKILFFTSMAAGAAATLRNEEWPPDTEVRWVPWKFASTLERLARCGLGKQLRASVTPLAAMIGAPRESRRTLRLATIALLAILSASPDTEAMIGEVREAGGHSLMEVLKESAEEDPCAHDLMGVVFHGHAPLPHWVADSFMLQQV